MISDVSHEGISSLYDVSEEDREPREPEIEQTNETNH